MASRDNFPLTPFKCLITAPDPSLKPAVTPYPQRGHTPVDVPNQLLSTLPPLPDGPNQLLYWRMRRIPLMGVHPKCYYGRTKRYCPHQRK